MIPLFCTFWWRQRFIFWWRWIKDGYDDQHDDDVDDNGDDNDGDGDDNGDNDDVDLISNLSGRSAFPYNQSIMSLGRGIAKTEWGKEKSEIDANCQTGKGETKLMQIAKQLGKRCYLKLKLN